MKEKKLNTNKLGGRAWFNLCLFGFIGQVAWNIENMYFNTFLYNSVYAGASQAALDGSMDVMTAISKMVSYSALTAVITTFIMGNLSDKVNKRKIFISVGYIVWGAVTACFGLITRDNIALIFRLTDETRILGATIITVIIMDCVMTFMGSTSNDSAFNAYVTDITTIHNRATIESVLAILPMAATGVVMALGALVSQIGYPSFFITFGLTVSVCGVIGIFTIKDSKSGQRSNEKYFSNLIYGFRPSVVKENGKLYILLAAVCIYSVAVQVFFPYIFIYLQHGLGLSFDMLGTLKPWQFAAVGAGLIIVVAVIILIGKAVDKFGKKYFILVSSVLFIVGLFSAGQAHSMGAFLLAAMPVFAGYGLMGIIFSAAIRDYTPEDKVGLFQGVRMIFMVLIPMFVGPKIGAWASISSAITYTNEYNVVQSVPSSSMFTYAGAVAVIVLIPVIFLVIKGIDKKEEKKSEDSNK